MICHLLIYTQRSLQKNIFMRNLDALKCFICENGLIQFVVLACNHAICGDCLASYTEPESNFIIIPCPCGITTNISRHKAKDRQSMCLKPCSSMPNIKRNKAEIYDQSSFALYETCQSRSSGKISKISSQNQCIKEQRTNNLSNYLMAELNNQVKFMELRFKRYMNEINRCYKKLVSDLNKNYEQILEEVMSKCQLKIEMNEIKCISAIQNYLQKTFRPGLERKLAKISKSLSSFTGTQTQRKDAQDWEKQKQNRYNDSNVVKATSKTKRFSTHSMCKIEAAQAYFYNKLKPSTKDSKIRKKMVKKASRTFLESANY